MICQYHFTIRCACPVDGEGDVYQAVCESDATIPVEKIIEIATKFGGIKSFQEDVTRQVARELGCRVKTIGSHSGVITVVTAP